MTKKLLLFSIILLIWVSTYSRVGIYPDGDEYFPSEEAEYEPQVVKFQSDADLELMRENGVLIMRTRGDIALILVPHTIEAQKAAKGNPASGKKSVANNGRKKAVKNLPTMDYALKFRNAHDVLFGNGISKGYQGKDVVVGICDIGFDPTHPAFRSSDGSEIRIRRLTQYIEEEGLRLQLDTPEQFEQWRTDNDEEYHATHVAGIMTGAYDGEGYRGVAADADIVISTSQLSDVGILSGAEDILDYAKAVGKPCVINISMGNYIGPHDGTSLFNQYVDMMSEECIIVLSSGNEGNRNNSLSVKFNDKVKEMKYRLASYKWTQFDMTGYTDLWSSTADEFTIQPIVYDEYHNKIIYRLPEVTVTDSMIWGVATEDPMEYETLDDELARYYSGWINMEAGIWPDNNRMNVLVSYDMHTKEQSPAGPWAIYNIAFIVKAADGTVVDCYADGRGTFLKQMPGTPYAPSPDMSISDLCCARRVISVGMHNTRNHYPVLDSEDEATRYDSGIVNVNSSYATLHDGRVLPMTVAPGGAIVSACSRPWVEASSDNMKECAARGEAFNNTHYWIGCSGTSMSSPYVAGFIASWLQANPQLTWDKVQEIIYESNSQNFPDHENPRHGAGWFDPAKGMELVMQDVQVGVDGIVDTLPPAIYGNGDNWEVVAGSKVEVYVTGIDGIVRMHQQGDSRISLQLSALPPGIYIINAISEKGRSSHRLIK